MMWHLKECLGTPPEPEHKLLTNDEVLSMYKLLMYSIDPMHASIVEKLAPIIEIIKHDKHNGEKCWENEGGACP